MCIICIIFVGNMLCTIHLVWVDCHRSLQRPFTPIHCSITPHPPTPTPTPTHTTPTPHLHTHTLFSDVYPLTSSSCFLSCVVTLLLVAKKIERFCDSCSEKASTLPLFKILSALHTYIQRRRLDPEFNWEHPCIIDINDVSTMPSLVQ